MPEWRCETCEHWDELEPYEPPEWEPGQTPSLFEWPHIDGDYSGGLAPGRWGWCKLAGQFGPRAGSGKFYVIDGSEYRADLNCRSDFGCVEWSPTPPTT